MRRAAEECFGNVWRWCGACSLCVVLLTRAVADETPSAQPVQESPITDGDRAHWAYRPLAVPSVPDVVDRAWPRNAVDRFILARLEQKGLSPSPEADPEVLLRRVTLDLTGLPPDEDQIAAFVHNHSPSAWLKTVDRLLASPAYGERSAQHWLDLARFAETDGFEFDHVRPDAWRYRDWVIGAFNEDLPYDEFVRMQVAGDELRPDDAASAVATGFLLAGPDMPDLNLQEERRHVLLNEMTATVGAVFLGMQIGCATCHDHKYDPISQADFYRLRAVFEPAEWFQPNPFGRVMRESGPASRPGRLMVRGDFRRPGAELEPGFPRIANPWNDALGTPTDNASSSGRRTALARWLTRGDHPLTTRVIVNRVWQQHFGNGLAGSASDFGLMGNTPTHPELLNWLAGELVWHGWSLKRLHRLMVTSATYCQASDPGDQAGEVDPENRLLARMNPRRLEGEAIRDTMLWAANRLNNNRGGLGIMAPLPDELIGTLLVGQWKVDENFVEHDRRSIYLFARRNLRYPLFEAFDRPDPNLSCARRDRSTSATQSLELLNSPFAHACARDLAGWLIAKVPSGAEDRVAACYRRTLARNPTPDELHSAVKFLSDQAQLLRDEGRPAELLALPSQSSVAIDPFEAAALVDFCLAMFNLNEFVYVD